MSAANLSWVFLLLAGLSEIGWAVGLKYTDGFSRALPSIATIAGMLVSFYLLALAMRTIPLGTAYAVWTGIGAVGTVILGMVLFGESRDLARIGCILLIVGGVIGLKALQTA
ncbi:MAG: quaternary ammonium compound efflux SMR transporter SugE [Dokdonella sp.]